MGCGGSKQQQTASASPAAAPAAATAAAPPPAPTHHPVTLFLPQHCSVEEQRAQKEAIDAERLKYEWDWNRDIAGPLPPKLKNVPMEEVPLAHMTDFILIFTRIQMSKVLEKTNLLHDWIKDHHDKEKEKNPFARYDAIFTGLALFPPPSIMKDWQEDAAFSRARTDGLYPWFLTRAVLKEHDFPVTDAMLGDLIKGHTLADLEAAGRLFIISLPQFEGVAARENAVIASPIELHWVSDSGVLLPLAIQLRQKSADSPIFTANGPKNLWLNAKIHASTSVTVYHTFFVHATEMHWVSECVWLAMVRNLSKQHPLRQFFAPHYEVLFFVDSQFRLQFYDDTPDASFKHMQTTQEAHWQVMANGYKDWTFDRLNIPAQYEKRGLAALKSANYRDDSLLMWNTHSKFCRSFVEGFYKTDADVVEDYQVQAWMTELASPIGGAMKGLPVDAHGRLATKEQLIEMISCMFFNATLKHSFLEAAKLDYFGYAPFNPDIYRMPIPKSATEEISIDSIVAAMPTDTEAVVQGALMHNGGTAPDDFKLDLLPKDFLKGSPPEVTTAVSTWLGDLKTAEETMQKRNADKGIQYTYCLPSVSANQIHN